MGELLPSHKEGLVDRILARLKELGKTTDTLDAFLTERGLPNYSFLEVYIERIGDPGDIGPVAEFLGLSASHLLEVSPCSDPEYARAVFDELLPRHNLPPEMTPDDIWRYVEDSVEFRGESRLGIRNQVGLVLQALMPPPQYFNAPCDPLSCDHAMCATRCRKTGHHREQ